MTPTEPQPPVSSEVGASIDHAGKDSAETATDPDLLAEGQAERMLPGVVMRTADEIEQGIRDSIARTRASAQNGADSIPTGTAGGW